MNSFNDNDRAQVLFEATAQFWQHIVTIVQIAFAIHVALFALFLILPVPTLLVANAASILAYVACLEAIRHRRYPLAGIIMSVEIIAHAMLATWVLGWESNFYFYLFCVIPIISFSFQRAVFWRLGLSLAIILVVVGGYALRRHAGSDEPLSPQVLDAFGLVNALTGTAILLYASGLSVRFSLKMQLSLFQTAQRDALTNLYNRRRIMQRVRQLMAQRRPQETALVLLDIDHFKKINDRYGHETGDEVLLRVAQAITASVRTSDMAARWGGEEFLVLMADTCLEDALLVAERILQRIREEAGMLDEAVLEVTATVAVATLHGGESFAAALNRADQLLYEGKRAGRNRVMQAG